MINPKDVLIPKSLNDALLNNNIGIFVGAGLSIGAGFPSWKGLLSELIDIVKQETSIPDEKITELKNLIKNPSKYLMVAEELKDILPSDLYKFVKTKFDDKTIKPTGIHNKLLKINSKFIITTNYDILLENAYVSEYHMMPSVYTYKDAASINYSVCSGDKFILKAHGDSSRAPNEIILTDKDYRNIIYNERGYQSVLHVLFSTFNILFLGVSLNDPEINLLLGYIHHIFHGGTPTHYALMPDDEITTTEKERWRKDYNIQIITYNPEDNHKEIEDYVDAILKIQNV